MGKPAAGRRNSSSAESEKCRLTLTYGRRDRGDATCPQIWAGAADRGPQPVCVCPVSLSAGAQTNRRETRRRARD